MSTEPQKSTDEDLKLLHSMGYAQELARSMKGFQNFAISFSIICILSGGINRLLKYPTQKCGALLGTFDFHATLSYRELPTLFEADFIGLSLVFPHFPRLTLSADGFAPACACA